MVFTPDNMASCLEYQTSGCFSSLGQTQFIPDNTQNSPISPTCSQVTIAGIILCLDTVNTTSLKKNLETAPIQKAFNPAQKNCQDPRPARDREFMPFFTQKSTTSSHKCTISFSFRSFLPSHGLATRKLSFFFK